MDDNDANALIDDGSGVVRIASDITLFLSTSGGTSSLPSASSSPPREPAAASNPSGGGSGNADPATAAPPRPRPRPCPAATAAQISTEDVSRRLDLAIMGCNIGLVVPVALNIKDLTSCWAVQWKDLYGILMILALTSTVTGFITAGLVPRRVVGQEVLPDLRQVRPLVDAIALFIVFLACKLGRLGCTAGVACAALVVLFLVVVWVYTVHRSLFYLSSSLMELLGA